jgi:formamidopyrimidine-DNA glycosylase
MPELAEVVFFRRQWDPGLGTEVTRVQANATARVFRHSGEPEALIRGLTGTRLLASECRGKWMLFRFSANRWLGIHLGMTGRLLTGPPGLAPQPAQHLVLWQAERSLVFEDPRRFGKVRYDEGAEYPVWWRALPPDLLSGDFRLEDMTAFLDRRKRSPIKSVLLAQERFPGIGNWMADEILWRAGIHPARPAGAIGGRDREELFRRIREVCRQAMETIGVDYRDPPDTWLFPHRWKDGGYCPATGVALVREKIGGRTTCWSPARQKP